MRTIRQCYSDVDLFGRVAWRLGYFRKHIYCSAKIEDLIYLCRARFAWGRVAKRPQDIA